MIRGRLSTGVICLCVLLVFQPLTHAFVLMGPGNPNEVANAPAWNYTDDLGFPKSINQGYKRFFRWNIPHFVYSFDTSFANYFGPEGMAAVEEAMTVMNDFFDPADGSYDGVTELDLEKHGFSGNYNTTWINTTAQNAQVIDIKSIVLGMMVNHLGLGNPHRHAFSIANITTNASTTALNFHVALRNYDPRSNQASDEINGVQYSYRMIHDSTPTIGATPPTFGIADMEEFTTDNSGNAWSSVAAVVDAFYGNTQLFWTETPSLFNFGVYYDGYNAMGGQFQPRHALTYDDAGGLKYLYSRNNVSYDFPDPDVLLVESPSFVPQSLQSIYDPNSVNTHRSHTIFPRRGLNGAFPAIAPAGNPFKGTFNPGWFWDAGINTANLPSRPFPAEGIDTIQFYHRPFDSLLGTTFTPTNFIWNHTYVFPPYGSLSASPLSKVTWISDAQGRKIGTMNTQSLGIQWLSQNPDLEGATFWSDPVMEWERHTYTVGRDVAEPDILFVADNLAPAADRVPVGFGRDVPVTRFANFTTNLAGVDATNETGPGNFVIPAAGSATAGGTIGTVNARFAFAFHKIGGHLENFEVLWSGEASMVGHQDSVPVLWAHIKGPGPNDIETFPKGSTQDRVWNAVIPDTTAPVISMVSDNGGEQPIEQNTFTRTEETLTIIGTEMASVTAIEIMGGDIVHQTIMPVDPYIVSNTRIDIPAGVITDEAEGTEHQIRVWNSVGASVASTQKFTIETGRPVITGTTHDNFIFDRALTLTVSGYGFKSKSVGETRVDRLRVDDTNGGSVEDNGTSFNLPPNGVPFELENIQTLSDTQIVLPIDALTVDADGSNRRLRVARRAPATASDVDSVLSPATNPMFTAITAKPVISTLSQIDGDLSATWENILTTGMYKRDKILEINGTSLNTVSTIEIVQEDGTSFSNPVFIQLPNAGVSAEDNGTRIMVAAEAIPWSDADSNETVKRAFKLYNAVANTDLVAAQTFSVNIQPEIDGLGQFAVPGHFNRDKTFGDDLTIFGSGFNSVSQVILTDHNDTTQARVTIDLPAPGVTVSDNVISIDTQTFQVGSGADTNIHITGGTATGSARRIIQLTSARDTQNSSIDERFHVGAPPELNIIAGTASGNFSRGFSFPGFGAMTLGGNNLGLVTSLEIVDANGNPIAGVPGLITGNDGTSATGGTGVTIAGSPAELSIAANATGWATTVHLLDSATSLSRRVKVTTPFGSDTTRADAGFRMGARPELMSTTAATFAGGGYTADDLIDPNDTNGTYDQSEGNLVINGTNFRSTTWISLGAGGVAVAGGNFTVDPKNPPLGITFNAVGTQITIDNDALPAGWIGIVNADVIVNTIGALKATSDRIQTQP